MSDLFSSLSMVARSLEAQRMGLDVAGQNIANVNTAGYTRRRVDLASVPPSDPRSAGDGVTVEGVRSMQDRLLELRLRVELPAEGRESAISDGLGVIEAALGESGQSVDGALAAFFDAFATLSQNPTSSTARQGVLIQGESVSDSITGMCERLTTARLDADTRIRGAVEQVNSLAERIAGLNQSIARAGGNTSATLGLRDELTAAVKELSQYLDVSAIQRKDGGLDIAFASGRALVIGENAYAVETSMNAAGLTTLIAGGVDVTAAVSSGRIGGLLELRDRLVPGYLDRLDEIAYGLAGQVNGLHQAGIDLDGAAGLAFFSPLAAQAGAARALRVNPAIAGNPRMIAAGTLSAGDNQNARALAALRDARVINGGTATLSEGWAEITYRVGQDAASARAEQKNRTAIVRQIDALREAVSGVSLDEEAMEMMKFQRAYEANARYFQVIDSALDTLLSMVGS
jgi:flagellar hook-associated protein 1 FlgK